MINYKDKKIFDDKEFEKYYEETRKILREHGWIGRFMFD